MISEHTSREGKGPTAEVKVIAHTDVFALSPADVPVTFPSSTLTVPMLGMFSNAFSTSQADASALTSLEI